MSSEWAAIASTLVIVFGSFLHFMRRIDRMEIKVDTLWDFLVRRAKSEARSKGIIFNNSPARLAPDAIHHLAPLEAELRAYYEQRGKYLDDRELFIDIEKIFGDRLIEAVAIPLKLDQGASVLAAAFVAARGATYRETLFGKEK